MATLRKLTSDEVLQRQARTRKRHQQMIQAYDALLAGYVPGDYGELVVREGTTRQTIQQRLTAAAQRHNLRLTFQRTAGNVVRFVVEDPQAEPCVEKQPAGKKRGRKPRVAV